MTTSQTREARETRTTPAIHRSQRRRRRHERQPRCRERRSPRRRTRSRRACPSAAATTRSAVEEASRRMDVRLGRGTRRRGVALVGLAIRLLLGGANRLLVVLALIPATAMTFTLCCDAGGRLSGVDLEPSSPRRRLTPASTPDTRTRQARWPAAFHAWDPLDFWP